MSNNSPTNPAKIEISRRRNRILEKILQKNRKIYSFLQKILDFIENINNNINWKYFENYIKSIFAVY